MYQVADPEITRPSIRNCGSRKGNISIATCVCCYCIICPQGGLSANEFYKKNNRWSEGLISAAKAVGWGASILV